MKSKRTKSLKSPTVIYCYSFRSIFRSFVRSRMCVSTILVVFCLLIWFRGFCGYIIVWCVHSDNFPMWLCAIYEILDRGRVNIQWIIRMDLRMHKHHTLCFCCVQTTIVIKNKTHKHNVCVGWRKLWLNICDNIELIPWSHSITILQITM